MNEAYSENPSLSGIAVRGFKSICEEQHIAIKPLTVLAGANCSGKSSIMQPLLLMKQTLEATSDPGVFLFSGPNVRFTMPDQFMCKLANNKDKNSFAVRLEGSKGVSLETKYYLREGKEIHIESAKGKRWNNEQFEIRHDSTHDCLVSMLYEDTRKLLEFRLITEHGRSESFADRCFLSVRSMWFSSKNLIFDDFLTMHFGKIAISLLHLPGLRGDPSRTYKKLSSGPNYPGTFEPYAASVVLRWQAENDPRLGQLGDDLSLLGLSWKIAATQLDYTQVELRVGRLPKKSRGGDDLVSTADVGIGITQVLPVLVALLEAKPGQLLYIEQPEIHLHPKAQRKLAYLLCNSAKRGVKVVVETHSALLLREIQTIVAKGEMNKDAVILHWFQRDSKGASKVTSATLDDDGAYGNWPEDFDDTELSAANDYLNAVEKRNAE